MSENESDSTQMFSIGRTMDGRVAISLYPELGPVTLTMGDDVARQFLEMLKAAIYES